MDFGGGNASGVDQGTSSNRSNKNSSRHTPHQIQYMEAFFNKCPYPTEKQQNEISEHLDLEPCQIKFWFQNRRTQMKTQSVRKHRSIIEELQSENANLKKENERLSAQIAQVTGKPISEFNSWVPTGSPIDFTVGGVSCMGMRGSSLHVGSYSNSSTFATSQPGTISSVERSVMTETANAAMRELLTVLQSNTPLWTKNNGRYSFNRDFYEHLSKQNISGKLESSKDSCDVAVNAIVLVNMILDSRTWLDLFPTLVTDAEIAHVVETGMVENMSGSLHLMREVMHTLSPLVAPREFYFLRYCKQVQIDTWVIADVSYGIPRGNNDSLVPYCRKLPSGFTIQAMPDGHSKVTWVELVEVDDRAATHRLYRDLVDGGLVLGAERWTTTLKQMCERVVHSNEEPANTQGATWSAEGKRSLLDLSHRMVKEFCVTLNMPIDKLDLHHGSDTYNNGIRVSTHECTDPRTPEGVVFRAATSLWLPLCPQHVFAFFQDRSMRSQWDFLSHGTPVAEIARAASGPHPGNSISVFKPVAPDESHITILQETFTDLLGYYLVLAPLELTAINKAVAGLESSNTPVLPSGFVISSDGRRALSPDNLNSSQASAENCGSLLTAVFQILVNDSTYAKLKHKEFVEDIKNLVSSTVEKILAAVTPKQ